MPLDGAFIYCLQNELKTAINSHIDKIHIPAKNEFVFSIKGRGFSKKLFISIAPNSPRVSFTGATFENPANPPMFCMLLRKHLSSGRIINIDGEGTERLIRFKIQSTNEMGDRVIYSLILEFIGHKTNLILLDENGRILDAARRSDIESGDRLIQPGAIYTLPVNSNKTDILTGNITSAVQSILSDGDKRLCDALLSNIGGISPLICRELAFIITGDCESLCKSVSADKLIACLSELKNTIMSGGTPFTLIGENGLPTDFSFLEIKQYGNMMTLEKHNSFSELLESFYGERDRLRRLDNLRSDLVKKIKNLISRNTKKLHLRQAELKKSENREHLRIYGELIKANIYQIKKGAHKAVVDNYYDPEYSKIEIPLNSALSPSANAAKYFKDYKKACTAEQTLGNLIKECKEEGEYLESVLFELQSADSTAELSLIRDELNLSGYIARNSGNKKTKIVTKPLKFSKNGFEILVGKNNLQNDELTTKTASKNDLWFHTKNIHGSHVILITDGKTPDDDTIIFAATLAAYYSKAKNSNQVPVDYTPVKFVKKPTGAKPGMVIYTTNKTIFANPTEWENNLK